MANRFWVGGSGTWNNTNTTNWSATSGGAGGASVPTSTDDVYFNASSGAAATVTVDPSAPTAGIVTVDKSDITLSLAGNANISVSSANFELIQGTLNLNNYTLTVGKFFTNNSNVRTIAFGATGRITTNNSSSNNTAIDFRTTTNLTITGTPSITVGGATSVIYIQNSATEATAINYTFNAFSIFSNSYAGFVGNVNINGFFSGGTGSVTVYGNFTAAAGIAFFNVSFMDWVFSTTGTKSYNCSYFLRRVTFSGTGTWNLGTALNCSNQIYLTSGALNTNNYSVYCLGFISSNTNTRALNMGSSTFTVRIDTNSTPAGWDLGTSTNMTLNAGTSTIYINQSYNVDFNGGGLTYSTLSIDSNNILTINGSNTFNVLKRNILSTNSFTVNFQAGTTTTVNDFQIKGTTSGPTDYPITLNSTVSGSTFTLTSPSEIVSVNYLNLKDSVATGTAKWYAGNNSIDSGNNTGWIFSGPPSSGFFMFF